MFFSSTLLTNAVTSYNSAQRKHLAMKSTSQVVDEPTMMERILAIIMLVAAIVFFILELVLVIYALKTAIICTKPGTERMVHLALAIFLTVPYIFASLFLSDCGKEVSRRALFK